MVLIALASLVAQAATEGVTYTGSSGPGKGKHIVLLAGDEEYRSEEALPQLAKILAFRHGFKTTVLFSLNAQGEIDPNTRNNQPGMNSLYTADLVVMLLRFREWPDAQMKPFVDYYLAGKPIIALRTSTHAFDYRDDSESPYRRFGWQSKEWSGGFGRQVLGETWISHWGIHGTQATRGVVPSSAKTHPILRGVHSIFGDTDVYEAAPPPDAEILVTGQVLSGMKSGDPPATGLKQTAKGVQQPLNDPMMPVVWLRRHKNEAGKVNKIFTTTMGAGTDLLDEGFRRLLVNGAYWAAGIEKRIPRLANVDLVGSYLPSKFGFDGFRKGVKPADLAQKR
ncbi:MAG: ThuA domain-containing protein [Fimbriimonadaceae bacterium]